MISFTLVNYLFVLISFLVVMRLLSRTNLVLIAVRAWKSFADRFHVYQLYKVPRLNQHFQENQLYGQIQTYLSSLPSVEDSDLTNLLSGAKPNDIFFRLDAAQSVTDTFLGARLRWTNSTTSEPDGVGLGSSSSSSFVLRIKKSDKKRIFRQYFQHILTVADEIEARKKEIKLYVNSPAVSGEGRRWRSVPFTHPASFDTVVVDADLMTKVKSDLELFLKSKQYYHRLGRVWKRSYLLYGPSGTGKTSFVAAMARFLSYDVYDVDIARVSDDSELKSLLLQTTPKSLVVVEDLDRFLAGNSNSVTMAGVLSFMDGIISCCGDERILVFTMGGKDRVDQAVLRPGRVDVHVHFPLCDNFSAFKSLASSYLGLKEHKLFPQVEEIFQAGGASLSPAEIGEIMISNRTSPSRALKSVISALQTSAAANKLPPAGPQRLSPSGSGRSGDEAGEPGTVFCRESIHTVREFRKLYGLLRLGSRRKEEPPVELGPADKEGFRHE